MTTVHDLRTEPAMAAAKSALAEEAHHFRSDGEAFLLDGLLETSFNALLNLRIAIARAQEIPTRIVYLADDGKRAPIHDLLEAAGAQRVELEPYLDKPSWTCARRTNLWLRALGILGRNRAKDLPLPGAQVIQLAIDAILRSTDDVHAVHQIPEESLVTGVRNAFQRQEAFRRLILDQRVRSCVFSHRYYTRYGTLVRACREAHVECLLRSRAHIRRYPGLLPVGAYEFSPTPEERLRWCREVPDDEAIAFADSRFRGEHRDLGAALAFGFQETGEKTPPIDPARPVGLIMPHCFADAVHGGRWMLYPDYYAWLKETLDMCEAIDRVQWLVKEHPASFLFREAQVVTEMVRARPNLRLFPAGISAARALQVADAVVTVRGTAGLEAPWFDARVIVAGDCWYSHLDHVTVCRNRNTYRAALASIHKKTALPSTLKLDCIRHLMVRDNSYNYSCPSFGRERPPISDPDQIHRHEAENLKSYVAWKQSGAPSRYETAVRRFFRNRCPSLNILDIGPGQASNSG